MKGSLKLIHLGTLLKSQRINITKPILGKTAWKGIKVIINAKSDSDVKQFTSW